jgi:superoxide reductase
MNGRREFLKGSLAFAGAAVVGSAVPVQAGSTFPIGLVYTKEAPGRWAGKEGGHAAKVTVEGRTVKVVTSHPMTEKHFIVKHTLITPEQGHRRENLCQYRSSRRVFLRAAPRFKGNLWATSFCNLHDLWLTEFTV